MAGLAVNVDHVATLREARKINTPDPVVAAAIVELAGADGVVVHLREDRRHIQDRDLRILRQTVKTKLILEMAATPEMVAIALETKPDLVTLVPEKREELTTEGGLDLHIHKDVISDAVRALQKGGIPVSIFIDPDLDQIKRAHRINANCVEIHTGTFCDADTPKKRAETFERIVNSAKLAHKLKLGVNAGHGLDYQTIKAFKGLSEIDEFSIGHSIIARAVIVGLDRAVRDMIALIKDL
ncbi:MAG: pyridoxine 5'-phosphate synthase [Deltaproteobacteria bacterium]|nr:pyridoxine 5'-phosphate synthase [Deltaproteobacteria bacterium]MBW2019165.1 pyridoxine 5'-phosphate synthase [Deltaproteobacteria bacterium]MBW2073968.1 pyridoxine 5'-phosphate synthase [Deltaproteobacteria bacterium]RLB81230.1 MAG: pyridoxine 5'-phosphate synthase [Deltaproteobacteria bacterium]